MSDFLINGCFWVLAIYGLIEIVKTIVNSFTYTDLSTRGINVIITVKNQEEKIEGFIRSFLANLFYENNKKKTNIIIADIDSSDETNKILEKLQEEYRNVRFTNWSECKEIIDELENNI